MVIDVIIVNYNSGEKTEKCVKSILGSVFDGVDFNIIVVDNASPDNSIKKIENLFPNIKIIKSSRNLGMGSGNNLGIRASNSEFVLVLNPDTYTEKDSIKKLYDYIVNNPDVGIVGPKLYYPDGSLQYSCMRFPKFYMPLMRRTFLGRMFKYSDDFLMKDYNHSVAREVDWLMGSSLFIRRSALKKIGLFDEGFFMYFEDTDLCRRMWDGGYKVVYFPEALMIHDHARKSADQHWFLAPFVNKMARVHIISWIKYFLKQYAKN